MSTEKDPGESGLYIVLLMSRLLICGSATANDQGVTAASTLDSSASITELGRQRLDGSLSKCGMTLVNTKMYSSSCVVPLKKGLYPLFDN